MANEPDALRGDIEFEQLPAAMVDLCKPWQVEIRSADVADRRWIRVWRSRSGFTAELATATYFEPGCTLPKGVARTLRNVGWDVIEPSNREVATVEAVGTYSRRDPEAVGAALQELVRSIFTEAPRDIWVEVRARDARLLPRPPFPHCVVVRDWKDDLPVDRINSSIRRLLDVGAAEPQIMEVHEGSSDEILFVADGIVPDEMAAELWSWAGAEVGEAGASEIAWGC